MKSVISDKIKQYPLEIRLLIFASFTGIIFSVISTLLNLLLGIGSGIIFITISSCILCSTILYFIVYKKSYKLPVNIGVLSLIFIFYPLLWKFNGGSQGPIALFMLFNALYCSIYTEYLNWKIVMSLQLLVLFILLAAEYYFPEFSTPYKDLITKQIDIGVSFTIVFITIVIYLKQIIREYNKTIKELRKTRKELTEINSKLKVISEKDELTGLYNRRYIMDFLSKITFLGDYSSLSLVMIDIDHFKKVNDTYGHIIGDKVLKDISSIISSNLRSSDYIGRIGGEEFLVVFPNIDSAIAYDKILKIKDSIENYDWFYLRAKVTVSCGLYTGIKDEELNSILENVDKLLYQSKEDGRNRITSNIK